MFMNRVEIDPRVCGGKPVIRGTRIPVVVLVAELAEGRSWEDIRRGYPGLTENECEGHGLKAFPSVSPSVHGHARHVSLRRLVPQAPHPLSCP